MADVEFPILGADFFTHFGILIDCQNKQLQNTTPKNNTHKHTAPILKTTIIQKLTNNRYSNLITNTSKHVHFADEFNKQVNQPKHDITTNRNTKTCKQAQHTTNSQPQQTLHNTTDHENIKPYTAALPQELIDYINTACKNTITKSKTVNSKYNTQHNIITTCHPIKQKLRPIPPDIRSAVEKEFLTLEKDGIVRRSASPWATPLHIVTKKDGTVRPCGDYRLLNSATVPDSYPLPLITDIFHRITSSTIFSTIDLHKAYHQVPVNPTDIAKTAVTTPFGLFEYIRMPFGLRNSAQTFQRYIDEILADFTFAHPYIDDILIASPNTSEHIQHLRLVFSRLQEANLQINWSKCNFVKPSVTFLGHTISDHGHSPLVNRLQSIQSITPPKTVSDLRSFLGMVNYCHRYVPYGTTFCSKLRSQKTGRSMVRRTQTIIRKGQGSPDKINRVSLPRKRRTFGAHYRCFQCRSWRSAATNHLWQCRTPRVLFLQIQPHRATLFRVRSRTASDFPRRQTF